MISPNQHFKQHHYLVINSDPCKIITLMNWKYTVGRDSVNSIVLKNDMISRFHATLERISDLSKGTYQYKIIDGIGCEKLSFNGVYVNGKRIQDCKLKNGDKILFGGVIEGIFYSSSHLINKEKFHTAFEESKQSSYAAYLNENETTSIML